MTHAEQKENLQKLVEMICGQLRALKWTRNVIMNQIRREQKEKVAPAYQQRKNAQIEEFDRLYDEVQRQLSRKYDKLDTIQEDLKSFN